MGQIQILNPNISNMIAAGEVVERISSVVKELVENSIDAGSNNIRITLNNAGLTEIRVLDDGCGMDNIDAKMSVMPHATSKIKTREDLFSISSLGFRGEALASIASVSNFKIITSVDGYHGSMITWRGGQLISEAVIAHPKGTEIIVKNLFFNTPARLQTLQAQNVELGYVVDYVTKAALARPDISFVLINNDKEILHTIGNGNQLETIGSVFTPNVAKECVMIFDDSGLYKVEGYITKIQETRSSKNNIVIIVNGRVIRNMAIVNAVISGYENKLMLGRYPIAVINIKVDPSMVDVNVHPSKLEVRFSDESSLKEMIINAIKRTLANTDLSISVNSSNDDNDNLPEYDEDNITYSKEDEEINKLLEQDRELNQGNQYEDLFDYGLENEIKDNLFKTDDEFSVEEDQEEIDRVIDETKEIVGDLYKEQIVKEDIEEVDKQYAELFDEEENEFENSLQEESESEESKQIKEQLRFDEDLTTIQRISQLNYIGQLFGTYILANDEDTFYLIDQHAANERINYEKIKNEFSKNDKASYELLVPFNIEFSSSEALMVNDKMDEINRLGITLEEFGNSSFLVRQIPIWIFRGREKEFVEEIITKIIQEKGNDKAYFLDSLAKSLACKKSIKGNEYHNSIEIEYLLEELSKTDNPYTCPHGRPVIIRLKKDEIEKWFKRIV